MIYVLMIFGVFHRKSALLDVIRCPSVRFWSVAKMVSDFVPVAMKFFQKAFNSIIK